MRKHSKSRNLNNSIENTKSFQIVEAYRGLRTNLMFSLGGIGKGCKVIAITSALPREGKTITTINIAVTFSQMGAKVLIIDCDLRRPRVHRYFGLESRVGLSNVLSGMSTLDEAIKHTAHENFDVMPSGLIPPNPAELLSGEGMSEVMRELRERYDYMIMDTAPANVVVDALSLIPNIDGCLIVLSSEKSTHVETKKMLAKFEYANANVLGFVLNNVREKNVGGYSKKYKYYGY